MFAIGSVSKLPKINHVGNFTSTDLWLQSPSEVRVKLSGLSIKIWQKFGGRIVPKKSQNSCAASSYLNLLIST